MTAQTCAVDEQRVQAFRSAIDRRAQTGRTSANNEQVSLLAGGKLAPYAQRPGQLTWGRAFEFEAAGQPDHGQLCLVEALHQCRRRGIVSVLGIAPGEDKAVAAREVDDPHRRLGRLRSDDLQAEAVDALETFTARDERRQHDVTEWTVFIEQRPQRVTLNGEIAQRRSGHRRNEHRLAREQVQLAQEPRRSVTDDLVAGGVEDRRLALDDRHERVFAITDLVENLARISRPFLADGGKRR